MLFSYASILGKISPWFLGKLIGRGRRELFSSGNGERFLLLAQRVQDSQA